ncbi:MAG: hypothetical protein PG981_001478 [Wolbachia endosymbiont of Ctenocephalides orientis wCori]|nr:MAG: hypothetical protein PG981_001478 [Wolbachia endosymbiont of Ctenocephalides orientis wCori]
MDFDQTTGLVNTVISLGKQPRKAAGIINDILVKLLTAREQGPEFIGTLEEAGIDLEEFEEDRKKDPEGALFRVFKALRDINEDERPDLILRLFGGGAQRSVALIVDNLEKYKEVKNLLADEKVRENLLGKEYKDHVSTTANQLRLLRNAIAEVGMSLGSVMLPDLKDAAKWLQKITRHIVTFIEAHPIVTKVIMNTIAILIGLKVALVGLGYFVTFAFGGIVSIATMAFTVFSFLSIHAIPKVITVIKLLAGSLVTTLPILSSMFSAVVTGLRFLTAEMISNPIGAVIALLVSGAAFVITYWQKVKDFFSGFWEYIKSIIKPIEESFSWMGSTVSSIFSGVSENSPIKAFEKRESVVFDGKVVNELSKNSVFSGGNPLVDNNVIKGLSKSNLRIKSVIEEKEHREDNQDDLDKVFKEFMQKKFEDKEPQTLNRTQNITNNFTISIKTETNQDVRSIANAVIERLREQAVVRFLTPWKNYINVTRKMQI